MILVALCRKCPWLPGSRSGKGPKPVSQDLGPLAGEQVQSNINICKLLRKELYQATYGDLVRLDLPRTPPTILVFHPDLAEQARRD